MNMASGQKAYKNFYIRQAKNEDLPEIKKLVFGILKEYNLLPDEEGKDRDLYDLERNYFSNNGFFGVVINERTGAIVGTFGLAAINQSLCELRKMYLSKKFRGGGIGKFILLTAIDISKQLHYHKIILETVTPLKEAIALYRQSGFIEITPHTINARVDKAFELDISK